MSPTPDFSRLPANHTFDTREFKAPSVPAALKPTPQQSVFLDTLLNTTSNITLQARAGCGKTSAILMGVDAYLSANPSHELLISAYNKAIQLEVQDKLKTRGYDWRQVGCQTVHGMGMGLLKFTFRPEVDEKKVWKLIDTLQDTAPETSPYWVYAKQIKDLVSLAKQAGVGFFPDTPILSRQVWLDLADHFDVEFDGTCDVAAVVKCAQEIYHQSLAQTDTIDFDDMVLFPLVKNLRVKFTKDLIFGDEAQDWSRTRQALVRKFMRPVTGRMVVVGDDKQAIYGFSGADSAAMLNMTRDLAATVLPLSVTWRCPKMVVELAQRLVPDLEAAEKAPEGQVLYQAGFKMKEPAIDSTLTVRDFLIPLEDLVPGRDTILCRNNAPLVPLAYKLIRAGIPAKVEGRKLGEGLQALCERWKVRSTAELLNRLEDFRARETQTLLAKNQDIKAQEVEDRVDTLKEIIGEVNRRGQKDVPSVIKFIDDLFADGGKECVTLATYHKSKGREWHRVFLIEHSLRCPSRAAKQEWQKEQERNLAYVAFTRSKHTLVFVD